jgi:hypothetical protein
VNIVLEARTPCLLCRYQHQVIRSSTIRVNKRSLREVGVPLTSVGLRTCPECGTPNGGELVPVSRFRLDVKSLAEIAAHRARRWPELAAAS